MASNDWNIFGMMRDWLASPSVSAEAKAQAERIYNEQFANSPLGKALNQNLADGLNKPFGQRLQEASQIAAQQTAALRGNNDANLDFIRGNAGVINDTNARNTDLTIRKNSSSTDDQIRLAQAKYGLLDRNFDKSLAHERDILAMQQAENARNRDYERDLVTRNDGFLKVAGMIDTLVRPLLGYMIYKG